MAINAYRKSKRTDVGLPDAELPDAGNAFADADVSNDVARAMARWSAEQHAIARAVMDGTPLQDTAAQLGLSRTQLFHRLKAMRSAFPGYERQRGH